MVKQNMVYSFLPHSLDVVRDLGVLRKEITHVFVVLKSLLQTVTQFMVEQLWYVLKATLQGGI